MRTPRRVPSLARRVAVAAVTVLAASTVAAGAQVLDRSGDHPVVAAGQPEAVAPSAPDVDADAGASPSGEAAETGGAASASDRDESDRERRAAQRRRVEATQQRLAELGWYRGDVDGIAGPGTRAAVRDFQRANDLAVDGIVGDATRAVLEEPDATTRAEWTASQPDPEPDDTGASTDAGSGTTADAAGGSGSTGGTGGQACDLSCRAERILALTPLPVPSSYTVDFRPGRDGYLGRADSGSRQIILWVRDDKSDRQMAATLLHEIGHAHDFGGLGGRGDDARRRWAEARGFDWQGRDAWFGNGCSSCSDYSVGAGDLAESVHACWAPGWDGFHSQLAGPPTSAQCDLLAQILR